MTQQDKLLKRFLTKHRDFTFNEMKKLLNGYGYREIRSGKTSGSRLAFLNESTKHIIRLHKPHPKIILRKYQLDFIEEELRKMELIK